MALLKSDHITYASLPFKFYLEVTIITRKWLLIAFNIYLFQFKPLKQNNFDCNFFLVWLSLSAICWPYPSIMRDALIHSKLHRSSFLLYPHFISKLYNLFTYRMHHILCDKLMLLISNRLRSIYAKHSVL